MKIHVSLFRFLPFSYNIPDKYVPSMQRASQYGQSSYGLRHFREEYPEKWIANRVSYIGKLKPSYSFVDVLKISISSILDSQGRFSEAQRVIEEISHSLCSPLHSLEIIQPHLHHACSGIEQYLLSTMKNTET